MNKEEIKKIYKCHLKVNIHCDGCKHKVKKVLRKIDGVFIVEIDSEQGKVTVSGNIEPNILIKRLVKSGKHAELWDAPKASNNNNNQNQLINQMKNKQIDNGEKDGGGNKKGMQKVGGNNKGMQKVNGNNQPKGSQQPPTSQKQQQQLLQQQLQQQQLQQLQQMKGLQDQKLPIQFKDMKLLGQLNSNPKAVKFNLPKDDDCSDDEFDDDEDCDDDDDEFDDEIDEPQAPLNKMKETPPMGNGAQMMMNCMVNGNQHQQLMNGLKNANTGGNGNKGDSSSGGLMPIQMPTGMGGGDSGKKGNGRGGNNNQGGGNMNNSGKNDEGMLGGENGNNGHKNGSCVGGGNLENNSGNEDKKGNTMLGGVQAMNLMGSHHHSMGRGNMGPMVNMNMPIGSMSNMNMPMGPMGNIPTIQGPPAKGMNGGGDGGGGGPKGCLQGVGTKSMMGNPFHQQQQQPQQQYVAAMMNQQRAIGMASGNDQRFQPMMYAQPPPVINYLFPQQYPYPPPQQDPYTYFFNDENTSSCSIM